MISFKKYISNLNEGSLTAPNLLNNPDRVDVMVDYIKNNMEFTLSDAGVKKHNKKDITLVNNTYNINMANSIKNHQNRTKYNFLGTDGEFYSLSDFEKTVDFGSNKGSGGGSDDTTTNESAQCLYCAMVYNSSTPSVSELRKNYEHYEKFCDVNGKKEKVLNLSKKWVDSSMAISNYIKDRLPGNYQFHRGSNFVKDLESKFNYLKNKANSPLNNVNKWNPSDIWMVSIKEKKSIHKQIQDTNTLYELNQLILKLFNDKTLIGISLKKVNPNVIYFDIVNDKPLSDIKYSGYRSGKSDNFFSSKDSYLMFDKGGAGEMQFRTFGNKPSAWQGELSGVLAKGGKIGGGVIQKICSRYKIDIDIKNTWKLIDKNRNKFYDIFYSLLEEGGVSHTMTKKEMIETLEKKDAAWIFSKYMGYFLVVNLDKSHYKEKVVTELVSYAASSHADSSVFIKMGK